MYVFAIDTQYIKFESLKYQRFFFQNYYWQFLEPHNVLYLGRE